MSCQELIQLAIPDTHIVFIVQMQSTPSISMLNSLQNIARCSSTTFKF